MKMPKSIDNSSKGFQIFLGILTAFVLPLLVFYITNSNHLKNDQRTDVINDSGKPIQSTIIVEENELPTNNALNPTPYGITNPTGTIDAGMPVIMDNLSLVIENNDLEIDGSEISLTIHIRNLSEKQRILSYSCSAITLSDDLGNVYSRYKPEYGERCKDSDLFLPKNLQIPPQEEVKLESPWGSSNFWWCSDDWEEYIPIYQGPIALGAKMIFVSIDGIGPFSGFSIAITL